MQNSSTSPRYGRLSIWGLAVGFAAAALFLGLFMWPAGMMMRGSCGSNPMMGQGPYPVMGIGGYGGWYISSLLFMLVVAGVAGAIVAAVHNAIAPKT